MNRSGMMRCAWALLLGTGLAGPIAAAEIYKWVDEDGVTHYTQEPPPSSDASRVDVTQRDQAEVKREQQEMERTEADLEAAREQRRASEKKAKQAEQEQARREKRCAQLRENVEKLATRRRLLVPDGEGDVRRLSEEERKQRLAERRAEIEAHCN